MEFYTTKFGFTVRHKDVGFAIVVRDEIENIYRSLEMKPGKTKESL